MSKQTLELHNKQMTFLRPLIATNVIIFNVRRLNERNMRRRQKTHEMPTSRSFFSVFINDFFFFYESPSSFLNELLALISMYGFYSHYKTDIHVYGFLNPNISLLLETGFF